MNWLDLSAMELAQGVRSQRFTAAQVLDAHLARLGEVNPSLNAVVATRAAQARREAAALDARVAAGDDLSGLPLLGVPCTIKEFHDVAGLPGTGGLYSRRNRIASEDAPVVARLKAAGALVIGVSNAPEGGLWMETYNHIYGWTSNPWSTARTPGGSSGGEGAAVASGASVFGLGSDVGGSIRIPAALCGTVGHKPTGGMVPNTGQHGHDPKHPLAYLCSGPLTRRVADVMPILRVIAGPDAGDPGCRAFTLGDPDAVDLRALRVFRLPDAGLAPLSAEVRDAVDRAEVSLRAAGCTVTTLDLPHLGDGFLLWSAKLSESFEGSYAEVLGDGEGVRYGRELVRSVLRRSKHTFPGLLLSALSDVADHLPGMQEQWVERADVLQAELEDLLGEDGVLLGPTFPFSAPLHRGLWRNPFAHSYVCLFNVLELPATTVPAGLDSIRLPLAVQLAAKRGNDHLCLAAAAVVEQSTGGWQRTDVVVERRRDALKKSLARTS